jgi:F-type H+-transporting ATPase subunit gamma
MSKARAILKRRKAVMNIRKITRTMQLIATARFQKAFNRTVASKPYTRKIMEMAGNLARYASVSHPLVSGGSDTRKVALLVITSNRGLAGGYNSRILEQSRAFMAAIKSKGGEVELEVVGKKGVGQLKFLGYKIEHVFELPDEPSYEDVEKVAQVYMDHFTAGSVDAVYVSYMQFQSTSRQTPNIMKLLPLEIEKAEPKREHELPVIWHHEYEFAPSAEELLVELLPEAVKVGLFQCFSDAAVSEQVGRMVSMKAATDNAEEMIKHLGSQANRARQSQITGELTELIGGAEALG